MSSIIIIIVLFFLFVLFSYFILAFPIKWWPYDRILLNDNTLIASEKRQRNLRLFIVFLLVELVIIIALIITWVMRKRSEKYLC